MWKGSKLNAEAEYISVKDIAGGLPKDAKEGTAIVSLDGMGEQKITVVSTPGAISVAG